MTNIWDMPRIKQYIADGIEENLTLDYKGAGSLGKEDKKKAEITKDVSAMANSAGGIIIYGIAEHGTNKHLPDRIDPIDRSQISKEWLEQVINNIRPKIDGLVIHSIPIEKKPQEVVYVVEIPQSDTAHQAVDKRYYKRFNFLAEPMEDYEIRDVMARGQYPKIELKLEIEHRKKPKIDDSLDLTKIIKEVNKALIQPANQPVETIDSFILDIRAFNVGRVYAKYIVVSVKIPLRLLPSESKEVKIEIFTGESYYNYADDNRAGPHHIIGMENNFIGSNSDHQYEPILPGRGRKFDSIRLRDDFLKLNLKEIDNITWKISADNAPLQHGEIAVADIERRHIALHPLR